MEAYPSVSPCSIGNLLNEKCHLITYTREVGISFSFTNLLDNQKSIIRARTHLENNLLDNICKHHYLKYFEYYSVNQKKCCDPLEVHRKPVKTVSLREIDLKLYAEGKQKGFSLIPGQKLCPGCRKRIKNELDKFVDDSERSPLSNTSSLCRSDSSYSNGSSKRLRVQNIFTQCGQSPINLKANKVKLASKTARKINAVKRKLEDDVESAFGIDLITEKSADLDVVDLQKLKKDSESLNKLIDDLKDMFFSSSNYNKKLQLLTLLPQHWSNKKILQEFQCTKYMLQQAKLLKESNGILSKKAKKCGHGLSQGIKDSIVVFFCDDRNSRMCPGMKEFVSLKNEDTGKREHHQKRILLFNLKELYVEWKLEMSPFFTKLPGFSSFANLRPKHCVLAGAPGTHMVCVCLQHQNIKLKILALNETTLNYHQLMAQSVCGTSLRSCMMHECSNCLGPRGIMNFLEKNYSKLISWKDDKELIEEKIELDDVIKYQKWSANSEHGGRVNLMTVLENRTDFIETLVDDIWQLTKHHFVSKAQSGFLNDCKLNLERDTCIILLDFAENYTFIAQDAVQSFHWNNVQATLHPFTIYYRNELGHLDTFSACIISDCLQHVTSTVHAFQKKILLEIKQSFDFINKVIYFSDGAASQYKNKYNFLNLTFHENDFGLEVKSWNFFATNYGKSPCDGIGGTTKRLVTRANLQSSADRQILSPQRMYEYAQEKIHGIKYFWVSDQDVQDHTDKLKNRFVAVKTIKGTRQFHQFTPMTNGKISAKLCSSDDVFKCFSLC